MMAGAKRPCEVEILLRHQVVARMWCVRAGAELVERSFSGVAPPLKHWHIQKWAQTAHRFKNGAQNSARGIGHTHLPRCHTW